MLNIIREDEENRFSPSSSIVYVYLTLRIINIDLQCLFICVFTNLLKNKKNTTEEQTALTIDIKFV